MQREMVEGCVVDDLLAALLAGEGLKEGQGSLVATVAQEGRLRAGSAFNIATAMMAMRTEGACGCLTILVPRKATDRLEVLWRSGADQR